MKMQKCARSVPERNAAELRRALRSGGVNCRRQESSRYEDEIPYLPELPGRGECIMYSVGGALCVMIATGPIWWNYGDGMVLGAVGIGAVLAYAAMRTAVQIRWHLHCKACRELKEKADDVIVPLREVESVRKSRRQDVRYIPNEVICSAVRRGWNDGIS